MEKKLCTREELEYFKTRINELNNEIVLVASDKSFDKSIYNGSDSSSSNGVDSEELKRLSGKIHHYKDIIDNAIIVEKHNEDSIDLNDIITISFGEDDDEVVELVGQVTKKVVGISQISLQSPLGEALYRKNIGDTIKYQTSNGCSSCTILSVNKNKNRVK